MLIMIVMRGELEAALPSEPLWTISSVGVLGPAPDQFHSENDWVAYKNGVKTLFSEPTGVSELRAVLATYLQGMNKGERSWTALLFHPKHWKLLANADLVSSQELDRLLSREWASLMAIPRNLIEICQYQSYGFVEEGRQTLPLVSILSVAISLQNAGQLDDSSLARHILLQSDMSKLSGFEINKLIKSIQNPSSLPLSWAQIIMAVVVCTGRCRN